MYILALSTSMYKNNNNNFFISLKFLFNNLKKKHEKKRKSVKKIQNIYFRICHMMWLPHIMLFGHCLLRMSRLLLVVTTGGSPSPLLQFNPLFCCCFSVYLSSLFGNIKLNFSLFHYFTFIQLFCCLCLENVAICCVIKMKFNYLFSVFTTFNFLCRFICKYL